MLTYASFNYPKSTYQLPDPNTIAGLRKKRETRKVCGAYYRNEPGPITGGVHPGGGFYLDSDFQPGRSVKFADEIVRLDHTGWFCDEYKDQTIRGVVICLPHGRFLSGWSMGEGMISEYSGELYHDESEAAHAADRMAELAAEKERDYQIEHREAEEKAETEEAERQELIEHNQGETMKKPPIKDKRYTINLCWVGKPTQQYTLWFCGQWINHYPTYAEANDAMLAYDKRRIGES